MSDLGEIVGRLRIDSSDWDAKLDAAEARARELGTVDPKITVSADTAKAQAALAAVEVAERKVAIATQATSVARSRLTDLESKGTASATQLSAAKLTVARAEDSELTATNKLTAARRDLLKVTADMRAAEQQASAGIDKVTASTAKARTEAVDWQKAAIGGLVGIAAAAPPVAAAAVGITGAFGAMGVTGALAFAGIKAELASSSTEGETYRGIVAGLKADLSGLETVAARGVLPGLEASLTVLDEHMPALSAETGRFAGYLGNILPTGVDAVATGVERLEPVLNSSAEYLERLVTGADAFAHSTGFETFVGYAEAHLPQVEQLLGDVGTTAGDFLKDWSVIGGPALTVVDDLVKGLDDVLKVTGPLVPTTIALVGAWKAASVVGGLMAPALTLAKGAMIGLGAAADATTGSLAAEAIAEDVATDGANLIPQAAAAAGGVALLAGVGLAGSLSGGSTGTGTSGTSKTTAPTSKTPTMPANTADTSYNGFGAGPTGGIPASTGAAIAGSKAFTDLANSLRIAAGALDVTTTAAFKNENTLNAAGDAEAAFATQVKSAAKASKTHTTNLDENTAAGRANREALSSALQSINAHATAINADGKHAEEATQYTLTQVASLKQQATAAGISKGAVDGLISKLLGIPKSIVSTVTVKNAAAIAGLQNVKTYLNQLDGKTASVYVALRESGVTGGIASQIGKNVAQHGAHGGTTGAADFGIPHLAAGGSIIGPGTAATDTAGLYALASGEEVVSNLFGGASALRPLLKAVSAGRVKTPAQVADAVGAPAPDVHVHIAPKIPGMSVDELVDVKISTALKAWDRKATQGLKAGYRAHGLLA